MEPDLKAVGSSPWLALHEAIHDIKELLNALINTHLLSALHNPLVLPVTSSPYSRQTIISVDPRTRDVWLAYVAAGKTAHCFRHTMS